MIRYATATSSVTPAARACSAKTGVRNEKNSTVHRRWTREVVVEYGISFFKCQEPACKPNHMVQIERPDSIVK